MVAARELVFGALRCMGCYALFRSVLASGLPILCYHGMSFRDEHRFRPKLFLRPELLEARLKRLRSQGYGVAPLDEAVRDLAAGRSMRRRAVITIDDGFYGTHALAAPILEAAGVPATVYVTSYYVEHQDPIYGLCLQYMVWRSKRRHLDMTGLAPSLDIGGTLDLDSAAAEAHLERLIKHGEQECTGEQRNAICRRVGERLDVDYEELVRDRRLSLMNPDELRDLAARGFDIQLHTHRHDFPVEPARAKQELLDNRRVLEPLTGRGLSHFCYPSGEWCTQHWPVLDASGVRSATTSDYGLNWPQTPRLALKRFLDNDFLCQSEFDAELSGFKQAARSVLRRVRGASHPQPANPD